MKHCIRLILCSLLLGTGALRAQIPQMIAYQGRVAAGGVNFHGTGQFKFAIVRGNYGGAPGEPLNLWSNDGSLPSTDTTNAPTAAVSMACDRGLYSVLLGNTAAGMVAVPPSVFANPDVRLRVWFNDGTHGWQKLTPDQRLVSVGYAMMAQSAETVPDGSINSLKLANGAVTAGKLANNSVTGGNIVDSSISSAKLNFAAVNSDKIADGSITSADILDGTLGTADLADGSVTNAKLATGAVNSASILDATITSADIFDGTITAADLGPGSVNTSHIVDGTVSAGDLGSGAVTTPKLAAGAVDRLQLADNAVNGPKIATASITGTHLAADSVNSTHLASGSVTVAELANGAVANARLADGAVTSSKIASNSVQTTHIQDSSITSAKLAPNPVPACRVVRSGNLDLVRDGPTANSYSSIIPWNDEDFDPQAMHDPALANQPYITAPRTGTYLVCFSALVEGSFTGDQQSVEIRAISFGSDYLIGSDVWDYDSTRVHASRIVRLDAGAKIYFKMIARSPTNSYPGFVRRLIGSGGGTNVSLAFLGE